jgi:hypothetical protein
MRERSQRGDEVVQALKAVWDDDPVEFHGQFYQIPRSFVGPKPVQKPYPPLYLAAYTPGAMKRISTLADGWNPTGIPVAGMAQMMEGIRQGARQAGRDPAALKMVVRANVTLTNGPLGDDRFIFTGSRDQIKSDIQGTREIGADELFFDPTFSPAGMSLESFRGSLELMKQLAE